MRRSFFAKFVLCQAMVTAQPFIHYRGARNAACLLPRLDRTGSVFTLSGRTTGIG